MGRPQESGPRSLPSGAQWRLHGNGEPVTVVVHGLGATPGEARIPASGLHGTRAVVTLPGHGDAADPPPEYWNYARVAEDVRAVADEVAASRAVGVSLGAGALTRIVAETPERFDRLALLLPAALDRPRDSDVSAAFRRLARAVDIAEQDDGASLRELLTAETPPGVDTGDHLERRAATLRRLGPALHALPEQTPLDEPASLTAVTAPTLVLGAIGDVLHAAEVAEDVATVLPNAELEMLSSAAPMLTHRHRLRSLLTGLFNERSS